MQKRSIFQNRANKCFYGQNNPLLHSRPPTHQKKRKLFCQEIHGLPFYWPSQFGIWTVFAFPSQTAFHHFSEKRDALLSFRPSQVLCCICLKQKFMKFPLQLWRYRCVTETWLPWAAAMWSSNGANSVCSSFNFGSASLWAKQGSKEENKIIDWLGSQLLERDTNFSWRKTKLFYKIW